MTVTDLTFEQSKNNPCITGGIHTWECDTIQFRKRFGNANVTSLVERVSRFTVLLRNNDRQSKPVMEGVIRALQPLPQMARRSITFDRGTEFTEWAYLQNGIGSQIWFCDPQSPWQKGTVENNSRHSKPIMNKIIQAFAALPYHARRSFTFDRGSEFMAYRALEDGMGAKSWFCDPNSP